MNEQKLKQLTGELSFAKYKSGRAQQCIVEGGTDGPRYYCKDQEKIEEFKQALGGETRWMARSEMYSWGLYFRWYEVENNTPSARH